MDYEELQPPLAPRRQFSSQDTFATTIQVSSKKFLSNDSFDRKFYVCILCKPYPHGRDTLKNTGNQDVQNLNGRCSFHFKNSRVYSFAGLEAVVNKFLTGNPQPMSYMQHQIQVQHDIDMTRKITELEKVENDLEAEMKRGNDLDITLARYQDQYWGAFDNLWQLMLSVVAALKNLIANVKWEIETGVLPGQQNYELNLFSGQGLSLSPALNTCQGKEGFGSRGVYRGGKNWSMNNGLRCSISRGLPAFPGPNVYEFGEGSGSSRRIYRGSGNWSMNNGPRSSTVSGLRAFLGLNGYEFGEGSGSSCGVYPSKDGQSSLHGHSFFDPCYFPYTQRM